MHLSFSHFNIKIEQHDRRIYIKIEEWSFECFPLGLGLPMSSSSGNKSSAVNCYCCVYNKFFRYHYAQMKTAKKAVDTISD